MRIFQEEIATSMKASMMKAMKATMTKVIKAMKG